MTLTAQRFQTLYEGKLLAAVQADPQGFAYGPEKVPEVAQKMTAGLTEKNSCISPRVKETLRELGLRHINMTTTANFLKEVPGG